MRIKCETTFLDGPRRFEAGDLVTVSDEDGARFVAAGWASTDGSEPAAPAPSATDLNIQSGAHGVNVTVGG